MSESPQNTRERTSTNTPWSPFELRSLGGSASSAAAALRRCRADLAHGRGLSDAVGCRLVPVRAAASGSNGLPESQVSCHRGARGWKRSDDGRVDVMGPVTTQPNDRSSRSTDNTRGAGPRAGPFRFWNHRRLRPTPAPRLSQAASAVPIRDHSGNAQLQQAYQALPGRLRGGHVVLILSLTPWSPPSDGDCRCHSVIEYRSHPVLVSLGSSAWWVSLGSNASWLANIRTSRRATGSAARCCRSMCRRWS